MPEVGTVYVNFPDDMASGDVVTGTVFAEPAGKGDARNKNLEALHKLVAEVGGKEIPASEKTFQLALRPAAAAAGIAVRLLDEKGKVMASQEISGLPPRPRPSQEFSLPPYGQVGRTLTVACPCDGVLAETDYIKVGGEKLLMLGESPGQMTALNTSELTGPTRIEVSDRGQVRQGDFRNIRLDMTASKLALNKGEEARLRVAVSGLASLKEEEEIPLQLTNRSAGVLTLQGGDVQSLTIRRSDVGAGGVYATERVLRGIRPGAFAIDGIVTWKREDSSVAESERKITVGEGLPVPLKESSGSSAQAVPHDVGIIPLKLSGCPVGSEHIYIGMDDEDKNNISSVQGWTGDITRTPIGTTFRFCRVNGDLFRSLPDTDYAVLQLSATCPAGAISYFRVFDNEHTNNQNWSSGNISPSESYKKVTKMHFCFFPAGGATTMTSFPNFYTPYGVFAAPSSAWLSTGTVYTDDNGGKNDDYTYTSALNAYAYRFRFAKIIYGSDNPLFGYNSYLLIGKASNGGPCVNPCPYVGSYDGANCWLGKPPAGTKAFIWSNNFYYTPVNGNQCPVPGSWFDSRNCFVKAIPPQTSPFIWSNMWYVAPACRP